MPARFRALDAWRGLCALLVVLFHVPILHSGKDVAAFANLQLCVDFFFVLSGFVISHAYRERLVYGSGARSFIGARFRRLWPLHAAVLAVFVLLELAKLGYGRVNPAFGMEAAPFGVGRSVYEMLTNLTFMQSFGLHPGLSWNYPAWSIAVEFWVSLVFAAVVLFAPRRRTGLFAVLALVCALILAMVSPQTLFVSHDWGFVRCLLGFAIGCIVYDLRWKLPAPRLPFGALELASVVLFAAFLWLVPQGLLHLAAPILFGAIVYLFSFERGPVSRLFDAASFQALGRWSFAIYMTHIFIFQVLKTGASFVAQKLGIDLVVFHGGEKLIRAGGEPIAFLVTILIILAIAVPVGAFAHRFIEVPLAKARGPWFRKRTRAVAPAE